MENNKLFKAVERSTQDIPITLDKGNSGRWTIQSQKTEYVNGNMSGVIEIGYTASINNSNYLLKEDKSNNEIQITALAEGTSGTCVLTQNESGNKINLNITTPEYWEIRFKTPRLASMGAFFTIGTNISGEYGSMDEGLQYHNWIVNQNRNTINIYISTTYPGNNLDILTWSCLDKNGKAFDPSYNLPEPDNSYFTIKTPVLGSYTLKKISTPTVSSGTLILPSRFNPNKKYPLDLNFYWGTPT